MNNYKLVIQYDGGRYRGWQRLGNSDNTIQGKIEQVLSEMIRHHVEINGCSRTDTGVHALMQVANFKTVESLEPQEIEQYLNRYLPDDISIVDVASVDCDFHARLLAREKTYLYQIWNKEHPNPFLRKYSMHVKQHLDVGQMRLAAEFLLGKHDFTAFSNAKSKTKSMVRELYAANIEDDAGLVCIRIRGNGFLHNMVRKITGLLIDVGLHEKTVDCVLSILESKQRNLVDSMAEACGLFLDKIEY